MPAQILALSDIHLGRRPSRMPDDLAELGLDPSEFTPAAAWRSAVREAIERDVDAVLIAGDVVDSLKDRFRALEVLETGVRRLVDHGISVVAVAGNHDVFALPRLADLMAGPGAGHDAPPARLGRDGATFRLLGRGGRWESVVIGARDGTEIRIVGWSFASEKERTGPLDSMPRQRDESRATIGLLHGDVDGGASPYAPLPMAALVDAPVDAWLLGHVHAPGDLEAPRPIGYLGSLVGLDPGEDGARGAWRFEVEGPGAIRPERVYLAPVRWERVEVSVADLAVAPEDSLEGALDTLLSDALATIRAAVDASLGDTRLVGCRVRLVGRLEQHLTLSRLLAAETWRELRRVLDGVTLFVEKVVDETAPAIDLARLARSDDPPGLLARALVELENGSPAGRELAERAQRALRRVDDSGAWQRAGVAIDPPDERALLVRAGRLALQSLLAQRDGGAAP